jgi:hypothetical protein
MGLMRRSACWKLAELDRILNDPTAPLEPHRVWSLLDELSAAGLSDELGESGLGCLGSDAD